MKQITKIQAYSWGRLCVVSRGDLYRAVIHPEHHAELFEGGRFKDEQGLTWDVRVLDNGDRLLVSQHKSLTLAAADYLRLTA